MYNERLIMRRPLFAFCLFVISVLAILTLFGAFSRDKALVYLPEDKSVITLTGRISHIDTDKIYINHIEYNSTILPSRFIFTISLNEFEASAIPNIGNTIQVTAVFKGYSHATNPGEFDAFDYYSSHNIYGMLSKVKLTILSERINPLKHYLYLFRAAGIASLTASYDSVKATVMSDLLFGDKAGLDSDIKELYQRAGISHILSISSLHISILGLGLYKLLRKLRCPIKISALVSAIVLLMFGIMTGMSTSAARAIGIYIIAVGAQLLGRTTDKLTSLALVATILLIINPSQLTDCGFLLSFCSVLGICCLYPVLKSIISNHINSQTLYHPNTISFKCKKVLKKTTLFAADSLLAALSITLTTLPIQLYFFYEIPIFSCIINLLVIPLLSILMISGYISVFFPFLYLPTKLCSLILDFYELLARISDSIPCGQWNPGRPPIFAILLYYLLWLAVVLYPIYHVKMHRFRPQYLIISYSVIFAALILFFNLCTLPANSILFLDVGQGDCILCYTDSHEVLIFDGGSSSRSKVGQYIIKSTLKYYGFSHINAIYISHSDSDHTNGLLEICVNRKRWGFKIDNIYTTYFRNSDFESIEGLCINRIAAGYEAEYGSLQLTCLHPSADFVSADFTSADFSSADFSSSDFSSSDFSSSNFASLDSNSTSMCLLLQFTDSHIYSGDNKACTTVLLTGDVEGLGESLLNDAISPHFPITLLKVAHHGSRNSTSDQFLNAACPKYAFISAGRNNSYGHPHEETLARLTDHACSYYSTIDYGAITLNIRNRSIIIKGYRQ